MVTKKIFSILLLAVGVFFALFPHSVHESVGFSAVPHTVHVTFGIICLALGAWLGYSSMKK